MNDTVGDRMIVGIKYDVHARYMTVCKATQSTAHALQQ